MNEDANDRIAARIAELRQRQDRLIAADEFVRNAVGEAIRAHPELTEIERSFIISRITEDSTQERREIQRMNDLLLSVATSHLLKF